MEITIPRDHAAADQVIPFEPTNSLPPVSQLPTEIFVGIFQLALPEIRFSSNCAYIYSRSYIKKLYIMRSVTKRWRAIIEGTPSFWTTIDLTFPSHVNEASILRSSDLPLSILYIHPEFGRGVKYPSATEFLRTIAHTRPRWSTLALDVYDPTTMSDYLGASLPLLQTIFVRGSIYRSRNAQPLELLGGDTAGLRVVVLSGVSVHWRMGCFVHLKCLKLENLARDSLTGSHLLNVLAASPGLQVLELVGISIPIPPPSPITTLHHLEHIRLSSCAIGLVEWVCHQIRAPSCTRLALIMDKDQALDVPHFLNEILEPFHGILRMIHKQLGQSEIRLDYDGIRWYASDYVDDEPRLLIFIDGFFDPFFVRWVDQILQDEPGLQIIFSDGDTSNEAVLSSLAPLRQVTKVVIRDSWLAGNIPAAVRFLSKPLSTTTTSPCLPCLREVEIPSGGWDTQDVLDMVQSRFRALSFEGMEETLLTITVDRGTSFSIDTQGPILDLATLVKIRKTSGVKCVQVVGWKDPKGMLAVAWNEEASKPVWV